MSQETILCVDDEATILYLLERAFANEPYGFDAASNGEEALKMVQSKSYAVVVSDYQMPGMDGIELLSSVQDWSSETARIMLSGYVDVKTVTSAINLGGIHYFLAKPWNDDELKHAVNIGLERHRLAKQNKELLSELEKRVEERTERLDQAYKNLIVSEKLAAVGRMAKTIVQEVLNPLSVISRRISMVQADASISEKHRQSLGIAIGEIEKADQILGNLANFAKQKRPQRTQIDVNAVVTRTLDLVRPESKRRNIDCQSNLGAIPEISADEDQLCQVLLNLANNALEAMASGGKLIFETRMSLQPAGKTIDVLVKDTGPGISEEEAVRIWQPFYTTKEDGTGFGLAICQAIVEGHGGTLEVASQEDEGSTFTMRLPVSSEPGNFKQSDP